MSAEHNQLFRPEAVNYQKNNWAGKAMLISKFPALLTIIVSAIFIIVFVLFVLCTAYTRRINIIGDVVTRPHAIDMFSAQQGYIVQTFIQVGDTVKKGDVIYKIDIDRLTPSGELNTRKIAALNEQISQTEQTILRLKQTKTGIIRNFNQQIEQHRLNSRQLKHILDEALNGAIQMRKSMKEYEQHLKQGIINKDQYNNQRYLFYQQQSVYQNIKAQYDSNALQLAKLNSEITIQATNFDNQISQNYLKKEELSNQIAEAEAGNSLLVKAPADGYVESLSVTKGQMVNIGDSLAQILPENQNSQFYLILWIPNEALPYLSRGDHINIRYDAFAFERFGQFPGKVESISSVPVSMQELSTYKNSPLDSNNGRVAPYYKALISLRNVDIHYNNKKMSLSSGMKAQATLFLEKRPIYQWMLSPFYDMKKSIMGPING